MKRNLNAIINLIYITEINFICLTLNNYVMNIANGVLGIKCRIISDKFQTAIGRF